MVVALIYIGLFKILCSSATFIGHFNLFGADNEVARYGLGSVLQMLLEEWLSSDESILNSRKPRLASSKTGLYSGRE